MRIGVVEGPDEYQFHDVRGLAVADDGTIYVGDNQTKTVRVFAPDGRFEHEFGGSGQGPGEYLAVNRVWLTQDGVAITDWQGGGRTGAYDRNGNLLHFGQAVQPDGSRLIPWGQTPDGWLAYRSASDPPPSGLAEGTPIETRNPLHRFDPDSNTLGEAVLEPPAVFPVRHCPRRTGLGAVQAARRPGSRMPRATCSYPGAIHTASTCTTRPAATFAAFRGTSIRCRSRTLTWSS